MEYSVMWCRRAADAIVIYFAGHGGQILIHDDAVYPFIVTTDSVHCLPRSARPDGVFDILNAGMQLMSSRGDLLVQGIAALHQWTQRLVAEHRRDKLEDAAWFVVTRRGVVLAWRGASLERLGWQAGSGTLRGSMPYRVMSFYGDGAYAARTVERLSRYATTEMELNLDVLCAGPPHPPCQVSGAIEAVWVPAQPFQLLLKPINSETLCGGYVALGIPVRGTRRWYECLPRRQAA